MATYAERILRIISTATRPLDDDEIAQRMGIVRQNVNQVCRRLEAEGLVRRVVGSAGKIVNQGVGPAEAATVIPTSRPPASRHLHRSHLHRGLPPLVTRSRRRC